MIFTSFNFLIFFPILLVLYYVTPSKYRWVTLLVASYFFYINIEPVFALLTVLITVSTYCFTRLMDRTDDDDKKRRYMIFNIVLVLLPLAFFKYFVPINQEVFQFLASHNLRWPLPKLSLLLPIGISFYTFMSIGYTIDVYNEELEAEKNIGIVALFISFFPLILSGPIERAKNMIPQFKSEIKIDYNQVTQGLKLMLWGYFMKLVIADRLGIYVDAVYNNIPFHNGNTLLVTSFLYPFQVYADLGGYSLIAIGVSQIMGFKVMHNFNRPFFAVSMAELWRRWHISLITWLTDYIYTPLSFAYRKKGVWGVVIALMITFLISGIWHGAAMTFVIWGIMQGVFVSIEALTNKKRVQFEERYRLKQKFLYILASILLTFLLFASSQVFGRAETVTDAFTIFHKIVSERGPMFMDMTTITYSFFGLLLLMMSEIRDEYFPKRFLLFENKNIVIRYVSYLCIAVLILYIGVLNGGQFIYFQF